MKKLIAVAAAGGCLSCLVSFQAPAQDNSINVGIAGMSVADLTATLPMVEYERRLGQKGSVLARLGVASYEYDDGEYIEEGDGPGLGVGYRMYPSGAMKGFYFGGGLGLWQVDWDYVDLSYPAGSPFRSGTGDTTSINVDLEVGGRFTFGSSGVSINPGLHLGHFLGVSDSCDSTSVPGSDCSDEIESELGVYLLLGVTVGFGF